MNYQDFFKKAFFAAFFVSLTIAAVFAQTQKISEPREHKLLNGLKLLTWSNPSMQKTTVKLRVHSGAAFDPQDKMGVMALVADILFPTAQAREFFEEDLEGSLKVSSNYDYIQITATGKTEEILSLLETVASAVANPQITNENLALVKAARLARIAELEKNPAYVADLAAARRLLGNFPYGRSAEGTTESLAKIDRADLLLAKERFLTADNATLAVVTSERPETVHRLVRQLFGGWTKADKKVPATFRQPDAPALEAATFDSPGEKSEMRFAARGVSRSDRDFVAGQILASVLESRLQNKRLQGSVAQNAHLLPGLFVVGVSGKNQPDGKEVFVDAVLSEKISVAEFERAKSRIVSNFNRQASDPALLAEWHLDADTYRLAGVQTEMQWAQNATLADVQRVADKMLKADFVSVFVVKPAASALQTAPNN